MHKKKMVAPIVISAVLIIYFVGFVYGCIFLVGIPLIAKILGGLISLVLAGVCIYVLVERIKEIRSGEEDDLSKY